MNLGELTSLFTIASESVVTTSALIGPSLAEPRENCSFFGHQRRVGRNAIYCAHTHGLLYFLHTRRIKIKFHGLTFLALKIYCKHFTLETRHSVVGGAPRGARRPHHNGGSAEK